MSPCIPTRNPDGTATIACTRGVPDAQGRDALGHVWCTLASGDAYCSLCFVRRKPGWPRLGADPSAVRYSGDCGQTWPLTAPPACKGQHP